MIDREPFRSAVWQIITMALTAATRAVMTAKTALDAALAAEKSAHSATAPTSATAARVEAEAALSKEQDRLVELIEDANLIEDQLGDWITYDNARGDRAGAASRRPRSGRRQKEKLQSC